MEIGGLDLFFRASSETDVRKVVLECIAEAWPNYVVEEFAEKEFFVFKNQESYAAWGGNDQLPNDDMIHVLWEDLYKSDRPTSQYVTLVVGCPMSRSACYIAIRVSTVFLQGFLKDEAPEV